MALDCKTPDDVMAAIKEHDVRIVADGIERQHRDG